MLQALPPCINGIPGNTTTQSLIAYNSGFLKIYCMLSIQFVCVLIIITVIGLIKASQELKSPFPIFSFCAKDVFKNIFALGSRSSVLGVLEEKETLSSANMGCHLGGCAIV